MPPPHEEPSPALELRYGELALPFDPRRLERRQCTWVAPPARQGHPRAEDVIARAIEEPVGSRLRHLARGAKSAVILVPGIDRVAAVGQVVPLVLAELSSAGVPLDATTVFLATGTHVHGGPGDFDRLLGPELARRVRCVIHDPRAEGSMARLGRTPRGTEVLLSPVVADAEVKVLTGRVVPHYFAGFGGGRKALVPGAAGISTIFANHRLTLAPDEGIEEHVAPCSLDLNPVHLDLVDAARLGRPTFAVSTLLDVHDAIVDAVAGDPEASHLEACRRALALHQIEAAAPFDAMITSAGGSPYDCSFVQALKALFNVSDLLRPRAPVLAVAECSQGIAPAFLAWAAVLAEPDLDRQVRQRYDLAGHNTIMLRRLLRASPVALLSALPPDAVRRLGLEPVASLDAGLSWLRERTTPGAEVAVVPRANVTHGVLAGRSLSTGSS